MGGGYMIVRIHGFDWQAYRERVMPAFARWLLAGEEDAVRALYEQTRSAREDRFVPPALQAVCNWPRAQTFVKQLPHGTHAQHEYEILCAADQFTAVSDRFIHRHPPQLHQSSDALRAVWGALVAEYCQSWFTLPSTTADPQLAEQLPADPPLSRGEIVSLLRSAGLDTLAQEVNTQLTQIDDAYQDESDAEEQNRPLGVAIGRLPTILHLRGWLASVSVRAMALFELLACERRCMPFGYQAGIAYEDYAGYLTPEEVGQLAACLRSVQPPPQAEAEEDAQLFRMQQHTGDFRMLDEVLPAHADAFVQVVRMGAQYGMGLISTIGS